MKLYKHKKITNYSGIFKNGIYLLPFLILLLACSEDEKEIPPPEIFINSESDQIEVSLEDSIVLEPKIVYNIDASFEWRKNNKKLNHNEQFLIDTATQLGRIEYFFSVETPYGSDSITIPVDVIILSDFNNLIETNKDSALVGHPDSTGFFHKNMAFPNSYTNDSTWYGFGISNIQNNSLNPPITQNSAFGKNSEHEDFFALVRQPNDSIDYYPTITFLDEKNHDLKSLELVNSTESHYWLKFGDYHMGSEDRENPDWCKVTITGIDNNGDITNEIDFYLADYRFENNKRDYIVGKWTEIDLKPLGAVNKIKFSISSSMTNEDGKMVIPETFCIDNLKIMN